jgi:hypothetical protein
MIKTFSDLINEASLKGNVGIPGEGGDDKGKKYLSDVEARASQRNRELATRYGGDIGNFMGLVGRARMIQAGHEKALAKLAEDVIRGLYEDILDGVTLDIKFPDPNEIKKMMKDVPEKSEMPEMPKLKQLEDEGIISEIQRRKIANNIVQGEAKNVKKVLAMEETMSGFIEIFGKGKDRKEGQKIAQEYKDTLIKISDIAGFFDWQIPMEVQLEMWTRDKSGFSGSVKVEWETPKKDEEEESSDDLAKRILDDLASTDEISDEAKDLFDQTGPTVHALGTDFSMLIHETVKGIYELISANAIPDDEETAETIIMNTDSLADEIEDLRYGPEIAADLRDFMNNSFSIESQKVKNLREKVFGKMMLMPAPDMLKLMYLILNQDPLAKRKVKEIVDEIVSAEEEYQRQLADYNLQSKEAGEEPEDGETEEPVEPEEETEPEEIDYSRLAQRDIQSMIDQALDAGDYDKVRELSTYLKESKRQEVFEALHAHEGYPSNKK